MTDIWTSKWKDEYLKELDLKLMDKIKEDIKNKENCKEVNLTVIRNGCSAGQEVKINPEEKLFTTNYNPVFRCDYKRKDGKNVSCFVKPNMSNFFGYSSIDSGANIETAFSLLEMGTFGYTIPEFNYSKEVTVDIGGNNVKFNILATENAEKIIEKNYLKSDGEITEISEIEAIDRLALQIFAGISDNKTINTKKQKKMNDKFKVTYFDPNISYNNSDFIMYHHFIQMGIYDYNIKNNINNTTGIINNTNFSVMENSKTFEYYVAKLFAEFIKEQIEKREQLNKDDEKIIKILDNFGSLTLNMIMKIGKNYGIIIENNNHYNINPREFYNFLEKRKAEIMEPKKISEQISKKVYYYNKNRDIFTKFKNNKFSINCYKFIKSNSSVNYKPVILSNLLGKTHKNNLLLNFKRSKGILYLKIEENGGFKAKQLYKEDRKLEDMAILIDIDEFNAILNEDEKKVENLDLKDSREKIQDIILKELIQLSNDKNISCAELSNIILKSINGDYLNESENLISDQFSEDMKNSGIYSIKRTKNEIDNTVVFEKSDGLGLKNLPKNIIELLIDRKNEFNVSFEGNSERLNENLKRRDRIVLKRVIDEFEKPDIELKF